MSDTVDGGGVDLRLAIPALFAWVAVAAAIAWPAALVALAVTAGATTGLLVVAAVVARSRPALGVAALVACAATLVLASAAVDAPQRRPASLLEAASAGRFIEATAETTQTAFETTGSFTVTLTKVTVGDTAVNGSTPARVFGAPPERTLGIGATIAVRGTLAATAPEDELAFLLFTDAPPELIAPPPWYLDWANALRARFRAAAADLPGDGAALLPGLAIGDTSAVGTELDEAMMTSSLSHLTAVSGANCAVVIGLIMVAGGVLGVPRGWRIASSACVLVSFVVLVTPEPSVLRAALMAFLVLLSLAGGRPARGVPVLGLAVIGLLTFDPWLARSYGFVLSVLATAGLLLLAGPLTRTLGRWLPIPVAALIAIPLAAQLACQPVLILLNPSIPTYGVVANVLAGPAAPTATVLGLLACILLPWAAGAGTLLAMLAWVPSAWIAAVATFFAALPGNRIPWPDGGVGAALVAVVATLIVVIAIRSPDGPDRWRRIAAAVLALALAAYVGVVSGNSLRAALTRPANWQYAACDVGQGDAMIVRSRGQVALIDTGADQALVLACLDTLGISRIDLLVLSHFDIDHVGATAGVIGRVNRAIVGPDDSSYAQRLIAQLRRGGAEVEQVSRGANGGLGEFRWRVLWPPSRLGGIEPGNDASVALAFEGVGECGDGCLGSVFLGDLGEQSQSLMLATSRMAAADVVKVAHHGSADQDARLYERLNSRVGLVGVGADNGYGHPAPRLLNLLAAGGTTVARTDSMGLVLVAPGPDDSVVMWSERG